MTDWWSQTGSNRRPQACKASALPTELWPRSTGRSKLVGLGGLEPPTSRLSSARSNQLSYKPDPRGTSRQAGDRRPKTRADGLIQETRETKAAASRKVQPDGCVCF
jgi:hypothetical protein